MLVYQYEIRPDAEHRGPFPIEVVASIGAKPIYVAEQKGKVCVWCLVDPNAPHSNQTLLYCVGTGFGELTDEYKYFQSVQEGMFVWHFFTKEHHGR